MNLHFTTLLGLSALAFEPTAAVAADLEPSMAFAAAELRHERVVKGAPYCADALHESVQFLHEGAGGSPNRIVRRQTSRLCRDTEGRTRQELDHEGRTRVYLHDPVAREAWLLDPQRKSARRLGASALAIQHGALGTDAPAWQDYAERMRAWAGDLARSLRHSATAAPGAPAAPAAPVAPGAAPPEPPTPPAPVVIHRGDASAAGAGSSRHVELHVVRAPEAPTGATGSAAAPMPAWPAPPPLVHWRAQQHAPRGQAVVTLLPPAEIEGLPVRGERSTWTIAAGRIGNERAIEIVREVWTAPDLGITVSSRDFDPRSGETRYQLQRVRRGEPDPALMRIPGDYSVSGRTGGGSR